MKKLLNNISSMGLGLFRDLKIYGWSMGKWLLMSAVCGVLCGLIGSAFHIGVDLATRLRETYPWLLWCLPAAGLLIVAIYRINGTEGHGTNNILEEVQRGRGLKLTLLPSIFVSTILTHLCGGSAGREGAALQMGGTIGFHTGRLLKLDDRDLRTATMVGMAAFFAALFGTPLAASVFAMGVISVGLVYHAAFVPCLTASLISYGISLLLNVEPTRYVVDMPELGVMMMLRVALLALLCGQLSVLFCRTIHGAEHVFSKHFKNPWLSVICGGVLIIAFTLLDGSRAYNGAGGAVIAQAVTAGQAVPEAFLMKMLLTALTIGAGYKGGEVVPSFFVGATFGCVVGPLLGIPAGFAAAIGLTAVFCGAVNCPIASIFLSIELFGAGGMLYFALACGISFIVSGYSGLYSSQRILYDKLKAQYIDVRTNAHREGNETDATRRYR